MECNFCKKTFISKNVLAHHQRTAKYCLEMQGKNETNFECKYCKKFLSTNERLLTHLNVCKSKYIKEVSEKEQKILKDSSEQKEMFEVKLRDKDLAYDQKIKEKDAYHDAMIKEKNEYIAKLEAKLDKLESAVTAIAMESKTSTKPTTTNNTTTNITVTNTNNVLNLSKEHVNKVLKDHLDYDVVYAGQAGFAKFVVDKMLKGPDGKLTYKCVDPSRQMFEFIDESGETVRDMRAEKLIQSLLDGDALKIGLDAAAKGWNTDDRQLNNARTETFGPRVNEYSELNRHNTVFRNKVSSLTT
jgi:hypothetical protein